MKKNLTVICAILMVSLFRCFTALQTELHLGGFSPLMALAFVGGSLWGGSRAISLFSIGILILTDFALNAIYGVPGYHSFMGVTFICYLMSFALGSQLQSNALWAQLTGLLASSIGFYLITNTFSWLGSSQYPQTFQGWIQSETLGLPGYPPSYTFLRNALVADLLFWCVLKFSVLALPEKSSRLTDPLSSSL